MTHYDPSAAADKLWGDLDKDISDIEKIEAAILAAYRAGEEKAAKSAADFYQFKVCGGYQECGDIARAILEAATEDAARADGVEL